MHIKSFLAGALCAMAVVALTLWWTGNDDADGWVVDDNLNRDKSLPADYAGRDLQATSPGNASAANADREGTDEDPETRAEDPEPVAQQIPPTNEQYQVDVPIVSRPAAITDTHRKLLTDTGKPDKPSGDIADVHAALEAESKDDSWAYYMEQALQQFLASHRDVQQFEISNIECRTTMCELQVIGFDESTGPVWNRILYDMRQQPWYEFGQTGSSSSTIEGRLAIISILHRSEAVE